MATVGTTSIADALAPPGCAPVARRFISGTTYHYFAAVRTGTDTLSIYRSTDDTASWAAYASFTHTGLQEWSSIVVDSAGYLHVAYRTGTSGGGGTDLLWYRRLNLSSASFSGALQVSGAPTNGGTIGARFQGVDLAVVRNADSSYAIMVVGAYSETGVLSGIYAHGVSIAKNAGAITLNNGLITGTRFWSITGAPAGRSGVSVELEHNGDGYTASTPNAWITWGRTAIRMVKVAWKSGTWQGPSSYQTIRSTLATSQDYTAGRWDGTQWLMAVPNPDDTTSVRVYQRNRANSSTSTFDTPAHTTGVVRNCAVSYDNTTKNLRVYAVGTSTGVLYYCDYVRATQIWAAWSVVVATAVLGATEWGVGRGGSALLGRHELVLGASGSPNTMSHYSMGTSAAPAVNSFVTTGQAYTNGSAANVGAALPLAWTFSDPDPAQTQGYYALARQIGAGALSFWNATSNTWGASQVQNASATQGVTLPAAWGADGDLVHQYRVLVWDNVGVPASAYSPALALTPSAQVNPTVTAPTAAAVINTDKLTITWTAAEQTGIQVRLVQTSPIARTVFVTGPLMGFTDTSYTIPVSLANGTGYDLTFTTFNNEKLPSAPVTRSFTVQYATPPAPTPAQVALPAAGIIQVTATNPAAVGVQPALIDQDLYRRVKAAGTAVLNANPTMAGNVTGWQVNGGNGTLTYSTTQSKSAPGSARMVPNGAALQCLVDSSALVDVAPGQAYIGSCWIRPDTSNKPIKVSLFWYTSGVVYITDATVLVTTPVGGAWHYIEVVGDPPGTAAKVQISAGVYSTPAAGDAFYADDVQIRVYNPDPGVPLATGLDAGAVIGDWGAKALTDYEYRLVARGANGTSIAGQWVG